MSRTSRNEFDWFPCSSDYPTHRKTLHLCELLGDTADAYPLRLMSWLRLSENIDGVFRSESEIEQVARWKGKPGELVTSLRTAEIIVGLTYVHWKDKGGRMVRKMLTERARAKQRRDHGSHADRPRTVRGSSKDRPGIDLGKREREKERQSKDYPPPCSSVLEVLGGPEDPRAQATAVPVEAAGLYLATFGGIQTAEQLAGDFRQLAAVEAPVEFIRGWLEREVKKVSKLSPWQAGQQIHAAWLAERDRRDRKTAAAAERARRELEDQRVEVEAAPSPASRAKLVEAYAKAVRTGLVKLDQVEAELRAEVLQVAEAAL